MISQTFKQFATMGTAAVLVLAWAVPPMVSAEETMVDFNSQAVKRTVNQICSDVKDADLKEINIVKAASKTATTTIPWNRKIRTK